MYIYIYIKICIYIYRSIIFSKYVALCPGPIIKLGHTFVSSDACYISSNNIIMDSHIYYIRQLVCILSVCIYIYRSIIFVNMLQPALDRKQGFHTFFNSDASRACTGEAISRSLAAREDSDGTSVLSS